MANMVQTSVLVPDSNASTQYSSMAWLWNSAIGYTLSSDCPAAFRCPLSNYSDSKLWSCRLGTWFCNHQIHIGTFEWDIVSNNHSSLASTSLNALGWVLSKVDAKHIYGCEYVLLLAKSLLGTIIKTYNDMSTCLKN